MVDAGIRNDLIYIIRGWTFTDEQAGEYGADPTETNAVNSIRKVKIKSGEMPRLKDR